MDKAKLVISVGGVDLIHDFLKGYWNFLVARVCFKFLLKQRVCDNDRLLVFANDRITFHLNCFGNYEGYAHIVLARLFAELNLGSGVALDVGAHVGVYTRFLAKFFQRVHAFEPQEMVYNALVLNTREYKSVVTYKLGLSDIEGLALCKKMSAEVGMNQLVDIKEGASGASAGDAVKVANLDSLFGSESDIQFIKIDVEGFESRVLKGASKLICRSRPIIAFEYNGSKQDVDPEVFDILVAHSYSFFVPAFYRQGESFFSRTYDKLTGNVDPTLTGVSHQSLIGNDYPVVIAIPNEIFVAV